MSQVGRIIAGDCYVKRGAMSPLASAGVGGLLGAGVGGIGAMANMGPIAGLTPQERRQQKYRVLLSALLGGSVGAVAGLGLQGGGPHVQAPQSPTELLPRMGEIGKQPSLSGGAGQAVAGEWLLWDREQKQLRDAAAKINAKRPANPGGEWLLWDREQKQMAADSAGVNALRRQ